MLTNEDRELITSAILEALKQWSIMCFLGGVIIWLVWYIISSL